MCTNLRPSLCNSHYFPNSSSLIFPNISKTHYFQTLQIYSVSLKLWTFFNHNPESTTKIKPHFTDSFGSHPTTKEYGRHLIIGPDRKSFSHWVLTALPDEKDSAVLAKLCSNLHLKYGTMAGLQRLYDSKCNIPLSASHRTAFDTYVYHSSFLAQHKMACTAVSIA
jgi:hypothetical protein